MTVKVIEKANVDEWRKQAKCGTCHSVLEFGIIDLQKSDKTCYFDCPVCKRTNTMPLTDVPVNMHYAIKLMPSNSMWDR